MIAKWKKWIAILCVMTMAIQCMFVHVLADSVEETITELSAEAAASMEETPVPAEATPALTEEASASAEETSAPAEEAAAPAEDIPASVEEESEPAEEESSTAEVSDEPAEETPAVEPAVQPEQPVPVQEPPAENTDSAVDLPEPEDNEEDQQEENATAEPVETPVEMPEENNQPQEKAEEQPDDSGNDQEEQAEDPVPEVEEPAAETAEDPSAGKEVIITKAVQVGSIWEGWVSDEKPAILKLDLDRAANVNLVVEGTQNVWATVVKSDRPEENPKKIYTDPETGDLVVSWKAERGSYLIQIGPKASGTSAKVTARFLDDEGFTAWEEAQQIEEEPEQPAETEQPVEEPEPVQPEEEPETEQPAEETEPAQQAERYIGISLKWDTDNPQIGDIAHFDSVITGYDNLSYTLQWQTSWDKVTWTDYIGATQPQLDVALTEEMYGIFFRLVIYVESEQEG